MCTELHQSLDIWLLINILHTYLIQISLFFSWVQWSRAGFWRSHWSRVWNRGWWLNIHRARSWYWCRGSWWCWHVMLCKEKKKKHIQELELRWFTVFEALQPYLRGGWWVHCRWWNKRSWWWSNGGLACQTGWRSRCSHGIGWHILPCGWGRNMWYSSLNSMFGLLH